MTTVQEPLTRVSPPPCDDAASIVIPSEHRERGIPPKPSPQYNLRGDNGFIDTNPLPDRCQFTFSDGRQCTMARSDIHPSLCRFHSEREEQLFGDPAPGGNVVGRALDLPELYSACRDLTTAAGVNRALAQVFRLLAQRRISRQEAATFGHLAQLLLRTISVMRQENLTSSFGSSGSAAKGYQQDALSPLNKVAAPGDHSCAGSECDHDPLANKLEHPTGIVSASPPSADERSAQFASRTVLRDTPPVSSPVKSVHSCAPPAAALAASLSSQASQNEDLRNSPVQLAHNEHMRKVVT